MQHLRSALSIAVRIALLGLLTLPSLGLCEPVQSRVKILGDEGGLDEFSSNGVIEVPPERGESLGPNLLHRFERFDVAPGDLVDFTSNPGTENIIARIDGAARSEIFGDVRADATLFLLNPAGFLFGPGAVVSVAGSLHVSTADVLFDANGLPVFAPDAPIGTALLSSASPVSFGFLDPIAGAEIFLDDSLGDPVMFEVSSPDPTAMISLIGGDVRGGGTLRISTPPESADALFGVRNQRINLASVTSPGSVTIVDLGSGNAPVFDALASARSVSEVPDLLLVEGDRGVVSVANQIQTDGGGALVVRGRDVAIGGRIDLIGIGLGEGPVTSRETALVDVRGTGTAVLGSGDLQAFGSLGAGLIVSAESARVDTNFVLSSIPDFEEDFIRILGVPDSRLPPLPPLSNAGDVFASQALIEVAGRAEFSALGFINGDLRVTAGELEATNLGLDLSGGGAVEAPSRGGNARFDIRGEARLSGRVNGDSLGVAAFEVRANGLSVENFSSGRSDQLVQGTSVSLLLDAGTGELRVRDSLLGTSNQGVFGESGSIELFSDARVEIQNSRLEAQLFGAPSPGTARQRIGVHAPEIVIRGSEITTTGAPMAASPDFIPGGLDPVFIQWGVAPIADAGPFAAPAAIVDLSGRASPSGGRTPAERVVIADTRITTEINGNPMDLRGSGGRIAIFARDSVRLTDGSELSVSATTFSEDDPSVADAGRVDIDSDLVLISDGAKIRGRAVGGQGGQVAIRTKVLLTDDPGGIAGAISVAAASGLDGTVDISRPEVDLEAGISALSTDFLSVSSLVRPSCAFRAESGERGELVVARRGLPPSPNGMLLAFTGPEPGRGVAQSALPPVSSDFSAQQSGPARSAGSVEAPRDPVRGTEVLRGVGEQRITRGQYLESIEPLREALSLARQAKDPARTASAQASLASALFALGRRDEAREQVQAAIDEATRAGVPGVVAVTLNNAGNQYAAAGDAEPAQQAYAAAVQSAAKAGDRLNEVKALANGARLQANNSDRERAGALARRAIERSEALPATSEKAELLIHLGDTLRRASSETSDLERVYAAYRSAIELSAERSDRVLAYAYGRLGALYGDRGRTEEALYLTRQALDAAERSTAPEAAYLWHWQEGKLLFGMGRAELSARAFERAVELLEQSRQDSRPLYGDTARVFAEEIEPVYRDLAAVLIDGADRLAGTGAEAALLGSARSVVEKLKAAELRDYFRDECVVNLEAKASPLEELSSDALVIYPIALADRTELLIYRPGGLDRRSVPVGVAELNAAAQDLRERITGARSGYAGSARKLYDWLVRPYADLLERYEPRTLVFVPSGSIQAIPLGALMDGSRYLLESYSIAVTPSMNLIDPRPIEASDAKVLVAGISDAVTVRIGQMEQQLERIPSVDREVSAIADLFDGAEVLRGSEVTSSRLGDALREVRPNILHIATHGLFTGDPTTSFLALADGGLTMNALASLIAPTRFREDEPLELLVMSACETASGDARSGLGLAGVAVRSGARSAIGSLWALDDRAAERLLVRFYERLRESTGSKAEALRAAQLELMRDASGDFVHPYFWSSLTLINNWL